MDEAARLGPFCGRASGEHQWTRPIEIPLHLTRCSLPQQVSLPDEAAQFSILQARLRRVPVDGAIDIERLAALTPGMSGADLAELCRRACQLAMRCVKLRVHSNRSVDIAQLAALTPGMGGADLAESCRRACELYVWWASTLCHSPATDL